MKFSLLPFLLALTVSPALNAATASDPIPNETAQLQGIVRNLMDDNAAFVKSHKADYYKPFIEAQHPRATVIACSDSRVHMHALDKTPDNDLFVVRNIGNQVSTAEGSVEYGVHHLHTPLLIIVGHSACGAVKAASGNYTKESAAIRRELVTLKLPPKDPKNDEAAEWLRGVEANVNNQVSYALKKFKEEVSDGKLTVIGAIYDFQNALQQGQGRLLITNINGNTDAASIMSGLMKISSSSAKLDKKAVVKTVDKKPD